MNDTSLVIFKAITNFVNELGEVFSKQYKPLRLYQHLLNKTQVGHETAIMKHIDAFREFCVENRDAILNRKVEDVKSHIIRYSKKVYINIPFVFGLAEDDNDTKDVIWQHLLCISALVDPTGKAKEILRKTVEEGKSGVNETEFLSNIISKVEGAMGSNNGGNPMDSVGSIMNSGLFTELVGGMQNGLQNGQLDIGKLMGAVQGMVANMNDQVGDDPEAQQMMGMINNMSNMMGVMGGRGGNVRTEDTTAMMNAIMNGGKLPEIKESSKEKDE